MSAGKDVMRKEEGKRSLLEVLNDRKIFRGFSPMTVNDIPPCYLGLGDTFTMICIIMVLGLSCTVNMFCNVA